MTTLVTTAQVRATIGGDTAAIDDTQLNSLITDAERDITQFYQIFTKPRLFIQTVRNLDERELFLDSKFIVQLRELRYFEARQDITRWYIKRRSNSIEHIRGFFYNNFQYPSNTELSFSVKYLSWFYEMTNITTETTEDISKGNNAPVTLDSVEDLEVGDYVMIEGIDRQKEATQITEINTESNTITLKELFMDHSSGSIVTKLQTDNSLIKLITHEAALRAAIHINGSTYTFNTSYGTITGKTVTKGVPATHWVIVERTQREQRNLAKIELEQKLITTV